MQLPASSPPPPRVHAVIAGAALLFVALPFLWQARQFQRYTNDDAFITLRYAWNLTHGNGLVYNVGERVEGYTSLLHALLAAAVLHITGTAGAYPAMKLLALLCGFATILTAMWLYRELFQAPQGGPGTPPAGTPPPPTTVTPGALLTGGIAAVSPAFLVNSLSGLETTLFALLLTLGVALGVHETRRPTRLPASACAFALMILTRPEAPLLFAVYWLAAAAIAMPPHRNGPRLRALLRDGVIVTLTFLALLAWRYLYYNEWLPNTYYAKQGGFWGNAWSYVHNGALVPIFGLIGSALALLGLALRARTLPPRLLPVAAVALTGAALPFITGTDWMPGYRFSVPYIPLIALCAAAGWMTLLSRAPLRSPALPLLVAAAILVTLWSWQERARLGTRYTVELRARGYQTGHHAVAAWLRAHARPGDTVALMDIGIIGYFCPDLRILDVTGLTDRFIAKASGAFLKKEYDANYVMHQHPEFIVLAIYARGRSYTDPPPGTRFDNYSKLEANLSEHPDFNRHYTRAHPPPAPDTHWLDALAWRTGATRIFEHGHPGQFYLLALYPRHPAATTDPLPHVKLGQNGRKRIFPVNWKVEP